MTRPPRDSRKTDLDSSETGDDWKPGGPVRTVQVNGTEVVLLGTAHVSRDSIDDVRGMLEREPYDAVAVELCEPRYRRLKGRDDWKETDLFRIIRSGQGGMVAAQLALSAYQKRLADQLGVEPGGEMRGAIEAAEAREIPVWRVDRNIGITLKRLVRTVPWYQRWLLVNGLMASMFTRSDVEAEDIEKLKEGDLLESTFGEFAARSPVLFRVLVSERDRYMAALLLERIRSRKPARVLVVIGAGHLKGLTEQLGELSDPVETRAALDRVPPKGWFTRLLPWLIVAIIITGFTIGFARSPQLGWQLVTEWVLINGTLTAIGALIARAHPVTIVTAFLAAPLTSLNPTIGAGMVTAAVETAMRRPRMVDFENLREQVTRLRGWYRNRVTRILLVLVCCTAGSAAATYIAGFRIFEQLVT